jgi:hypothetical protein
MGAERTASQLLGSRLTHGHLGRSPRPARNLTGRVAARPACHHERAPHAAASKLTFLTIEPIGVLGMARRGASDAPPTTC